MITKTIVIKKEALWAKVICLICIINAHIALCGHQNEQPTVATLLAQGAKACETEDFDTALLYLNQAQSLDPINIELLFKLGHIHLCRGDVPQALHAYYSLIKHFPQYSTSALYNIGYALKTAGYIDKAIEIFRKIILVNPEYEAARLGLSFALITKGSFQEGFKAHEWNLIKQGKNAPELRALLAENTIAGKTILLIPEGGLGDTINFFPCAKELKQRGARIIALVQKPLYELLKNCNYYDCVIEAGSHIPPHDARVTYMSLPSILHCSQETLQRDVPYITANKILQEKWKAFFASDKKCKVGICWQVDIHNDSSRLPMARRGIPCELLASLSTLPNVSLYSLQQKDGANDIQHISNNFRVTTFDDTFDQIHGNFSDTAAVINNLDLIICVDSAVGHLAGGLGCRVWLLLPYSSDWRWVSGKTSSEWYPTMTLFKQPMPFDWHSVIQRVRWELNILSEAFITQ